MRTRLLTVAKRRLGSIGAARGVCSHPGRAARHESPEGELRRLAGYDQTSVSLKVTLDTGLGLCYVGKGLSDVLIGLSPHKLICEVILWTSTRESTF